MNRIPKAGDVVQIGTKRIEHLVVDGGQAQEGDNRAGCMYTWFAAVPANKVDPVTGTIDGLKVKKYYTSCVGASYPITDLDDIRLLATAKFKKTVAVTYKITKVKDV